MAVPVRKMQMIAGQMEQRLQSATYRMLLQRQEKLQSLARAIPKTRKRMLEHSLQRMDEWVRSIPEVSEY